jgi:5'-methylthioadenosine phosphorylase
MTKKIGIIGGSGLEKLDIIKNPVEHKPYTPYGDPSAPLISGEIDGVEVVMLSRHGIDHTIPPSKINNRANIWAFKGLGCTHLLSTTACGSLKEEIQRGDLVFPDQFIDFTRHREVTFYETFPAGKMKHEQMADPFDARINSLLIECAKSAGLRYHNSGTIITVEGPRFSTGQNRRCSECGELI